MDVKLKHSLLKFFSKTLENDSFFWFEPESELILIAFDLFAANANSELLIRSQHFSEYDPRSIWKDFNQDQLTSKDYYQAQISIDELRSFMIDLHKKKEAFFVESHQYIPNKENWRANISSCYDSFNNNSFNKLVMCRNTSLNYQGDCDPRGILIELLLNQDNSSFFFLKRSNSVFLGGSPEKLFFRNRDQIVSDALAGTRSRGLDDREDIKIERKLLKNSKELKEQKFVEDRIVNVFKEICDEVKVSEKVQVKKLKNVQHLHTVVKGNLKNNISDSEIIDLLHPTPAVGGLPKKGSIQRIAEIEKFNRGLYAAPIGIKLGEISQYLVGIRSLLHDSNNKIIHIYTGAGIVDGSLAENEWKEINKKMKNYLSILKYDIDQ